MKFLLSALVLLALALPAKACDEHDAYAYATANANSNGAVFIEITNDGDADKLISVSTPVAEKAELHSMTTDDKGVMQMRQLDSLDIAAHSSISLTPAGNHIMLLGMKGPLIAGTTFPLTLKFEKQGEKQITVSVHAPGETIDDMSKHEHHH